MGFQCLGARISSFMLHRLGLKQFKVCCCRGSGLLEFRILRPRVYVEALIIRMGVWPPSSSTVNEEP